MCTTKAPDHADKKSKARPDTVSADLEPAPEPKCLGTDASHSGVDGGLAGYTRTHIQNPSYLRAMHLLDRHFRREAELASLASKAADDGFEAFSILSSADYNKSSSMALALLEAALAAIPAASSILGAMKELASGAKSAALLAGAARLAKATEAVARGVDKTHAVMERASKIAEGIEHVRKADTATREVTSTGEVASGAQARGNFQIETIHSLTDLAADGAIHRWMAEDFQDAMLSQLEFAPESIDLVQLVTDALQERALPEPAALKGVLAAVSTEFELNLYVSYYFDEGRVTRVTLERDGEISHYLDGLPAAVERRLFLSGRLAKQAQRKDLPTRNERLDWHGNRV